MENKVKIEKELFTPLSAEEKKVKVAVRPSIGYWKDAWTRLKRDKMALDLYSNNSYCCCSYFCSYII